MKGFVYRCAYFKGIPVELYLELRLLDRAFSLKNTLSSRLLNSLGDLMNLATKKNHNMQRCILQRNVVPNCLKESWLIWS
jgi:hypothetical protein